MVTTKTAGQPGIDDGTAVVTNSASAATSGRWFSAHDGATWTAASDVDVDVDIDIVVPVAEAWRPGANTWTTITVTFSRTCHRHIQMT
jgi:hypothetical protein